MFITCSYDMKRKVIKFTNAFKINYNNIYLDIEINK